LLGEEDFVVYCTDEQIKCVTYDLGTCYASSWTLSHGDLSLCFNRDQKVLSFGKGSDHGSYYDDFCKKKFSCIGDGCECPKTEKHKYSDILRWGVKCPFKIDKW
jgi:hypothetical protein